MKTKNAATRLHPILQCLMHSIVCGQPGLMRQMKRCRQAPNRRGEAHSTHTLPPCPGKQKGVSWAAVAAGMAVCTQLCRKFCSEQEGIVGGTLGKVKFSLDPVHHAWHAINQSTEDEDNCTAFTVRRCRSKLYRNMQAKSLKSGRWPRLASYRHVLDQGNFRRTFSRAGRYSRAEMRGGVLALAHILSRVMFRADDWGGIHHAATR